MREICPKELCVGCLSCVNSCTHQAIEFEKDVCGFRYPIIDQEKCVDCGLCGFVCPVNHPPEKYFPKECYAVTVKSERELFSCASGGAATAIARHVLNTGGVVYGCSGMDIRHVRHVRISRMEELDLLKGSKYVQSDLGLTFKQIRGDLKVGKEVLFVGTPCQVGGLKTYLRKDYDNLITADLVCHGVPSQQLLNDNIDHYRKKGVDLQEDSIRFRTKMSSQTQSFKIEYGWFFLKNQPYSGSPSKKAYYRDPYMFGFIQGLFFRASCYKCPYAYAVRVGDFTLSDFWGLGKDARMELGKGVSAVFINTEKARALFEVMKEEVAYEPREVQEAIVGNGQLQRPSSRHPQYDLFRRLYPRYGLAKAVDMCLRKDLVKIHLKGMIEGVRNLIKL